jgi:ribonuclease-3
MDNTGYLALEERLGYRFRAIGLLERALTHRSFLNEQVALSGGGREDNERLEFLGDAVLSLTIGHLLMEAFPERAEGELSKTRAHLVSAEGLAEVAAALQLGQWLFLGRGEEQTGGRRKPSLLADACEAVIGAVYLDGGFGEALDVVRRLFGQALQEARESAGRDWKTRLQERAQALFKLPPRYSVIGTAGPDHDKTFEVAASIGEREYSRASGKSKKEAEQRAAERALEVVEREAAGRT